MFELYLDIQKQKVLEELSDDEVLGRWKSFVGKWYISTFLVTPSYQYRQIQEANICEEPWRIS